MSSKHKKKKMNSHQLAQHRAEGKKKFFHHIENLCSLVDGENFFQLIPKEELEKIYLRRRLPYVIVPAKEEFIPENKIKSIKGYFTGYLNTYGIAITPDGKEINLTELYTIGLVFIHYLNSIEEDSYENAGKVKELAEKYLPFKELLRNASDELENITLKATTIVSEFPVRIFCLKYEFGSRKTGFGGRTNTVTIHSYVPEKIKIDKDDKVRPAFELCWGSARKGFISCSISSNKLNVDPDKENYELKVYIQMHAIQRLRERLDCVNEMSINVWLVFSVLDPKIQKEDDTNYLIDFSISNIKVGYLAAELINGIVVIKTFLFMTQAGTPEAKKLKEWCGINRLDVSYLALDRLSTYVFNDLCVKKELSSLLRVAGCQYLLDLYTDSNLRSICEQKDSYTRMELITKYLGLKKESNRVMGDLLNNT